MSSITFTCVVETGDFKMSSDGDSKHVTWSEEYTVSV